MESDDKVVIRWYFWWYNDNVDEYSFIDLKILIFLRV